jgi:hypothetical protein
LKKGLGDHYEKDEKIRQVADFTARELVIIGAGFTLSHSPKLDTECALIVWYNKKGNHEKPELVEFSFRYGNEEEKYTQEMAQRALNVFKKLQSLTWVDSDSKTKTAYVYSLANKKCH